MSGICGIWALDTHWDGASSRIPAGLKAMEHRGPDGFSVYFDRHVGLGHCLLDTGCNGMLVDEDGFAISFDGRLDNREYLLDCLCKGDGPIPLNPESLHDRALLLLLYKAWREELPGKLRGDFAIAVWDPERTVLFLCRDQLGVRPLFWHRSDEAIYCASEIKALRAMAEVEDFPVREAGAIGYLAGTLDSRQPQNTIYQGIYRLLPGHFACIGNTGMRTECYWRLAPGMPVRRPDTAVHFRRLLQQSIDRRLRAGSRIGALLSGGLDSSAIVSLVGAGATRRRLTDLPVFSLVFRGARDESGYIEAVEAAYGFKAKRIDGSAVSAFQDCDAIIAEQDQPVPAPNIATFRHFLHRVAKEGGVRILLDGHGGDETTSYGNGIFQELAESGRWWGLWRELGENDELQPRRARTFADLVRSRGLRAWRRAAGRLVRGKRAPGDLVRFTADGRARPFEQAFHLSKLTSPLFGEALEGIDHNAAAAGIEIRMPFVDVDLVEFCVTVPADEKWSRGLPRAVLRTALAQILPPAIAARRDKFDFTDLVRTSLLQRHSGLVHRALYEASEKLARYADLGKLRATWEAFRRSGTITGEGLQELWRSVMLQRWLQSRDAPGRATAGTNLAVPAE